MTTHNQKSDTQAIIETIINDCVEYIKESNEDDWRMTDIIELFEAKAGAYHCAGRFDFVHKCAIDIASKVEGQMITVYETDRKPLNDANEAIERAKYILDRTWSDTQVVSFDEIRDTLQNALDIIDKLRDRV